MNKNSNRIAKELLKIASLINSSDINDDLSDSIDCLIKTQDLINKTKNYFTGTDLNEKISKAKSLVEKANNLLQDVKDHINKNK